MPAKLWDDERSGHEDVALEETSRSGETNFESLWNAQLPRPSPPPPTNGRATMWQRTGVGRRRRRKRQIRTIIVVGVVLVIALALDGAWARLTLRSRFERVEAELRAGLESLRTGDLDASRDHFESADEGADSVATGLEHPSAIVASLLPLISRDVDVLTSLGKASELAAESGLTAVELSETLGVSGGAFASSLYADGGVNLDAVQRGEPFLEDIVGLLSEAEFELDNAPDANLDELRDVQAAVGDEIAGASETARKSLSIFGALPALLGQSEEQRYFLAFQTLSEARGTGGLIGLYGILTAQDGQINLEKVAPIDELTATPIEPVSGPEWFEARYGPFASLRQWQQVNMSPNLPAVSEVLLDMYEETRGVRLDGVVAMDPIALGMISNGTGPLEAEGLDVAITEDNAAEVLLKTVYEEFPDNDSQNAYLGALIESFWGTIQNGEVDAPELIAGMGAAASSRHFSMYSAETGAEEALVETGIAGNYDSYGPNVQMVFHDNLAANKLDYFLTRRIDTDIKVEEDGSALVTTKVKVHNDAPTSGSPLLDIRNPSDPPGLNRLFLNAILPRDAQVQKLSVDGEFRSAIPDQEHGYPVVWDIVVLKPGESATMKVAYRLPSIVGGGDRFAFVFVPQATVTPDEFSLDVTPPPGLEARVSDNEGEGSESSFSGQLDSVRSFEILIDEP